MGVLRPARKVSSPAIAGILLLIFGVCPRMDTAPASTTDAPARSSQWTDLLNRLWRRRTLLFLVVLTALVIVTRLPTMSQPLVEHHSFRQTHTAYVTREFTRNGIDLFHYHLPVLGVKGEIPLEFPVFEALATIPVNMGMGLDKAMRTSGLFFFCISLILLYFLVRKLFGARAAVLASLWFAFSPFSFEWSRASLIEFCVVAFSLAFALSAIEYREVIRDASTSSRRRWALLITAIVFGSLAMLVKPTTAAFWFIPVLIYGTQTTTSVKGWLRERLHPGVIAFVVVPFVLTEAWTKFADHVKNQDLATRWLSSDEQNTWNYGDIHQRLQATNWHTIFTRTSQLIVVMPITVFIGLGLLASVRAKRQWTGFAMLAICFLPAIVFFNLYVVHDYYQCAILAQCCIVLGLIGDRLLAIPKQIAARSALAFGVAMFALFGFVGGHDYWRMPFKKIPVPTGDPTELAAYSAPNEVSMVQLNDQSWDPSLAYYADRKVQMLPSVPLENPAWVKQLQSLGYHTLFSQGVNATTANILQPNLWIAPVSDHVMKFGNANDSRPDGARAIASSSLPSNLKKYSSAATTKAEDRSCTDATPLTTTDVTGAQWEWYEVSHRSGAADAWFAVNNGAFPGRQYMAVPIQQSNVVTCEGSYELTPVGTSAAPTW
jgi:hypothetical protein